MPRPPRAVPKKCEITARSNIRLYVQNLLCQVCFSELCGAIWYKHTPKDWAWLAVGGDFPSVPLLRSPPLLPCSHLQVQDVWKGWANQWWISELGSSIPTPSKDQELAVDELKWVQGEIIVQISRVAPILQFVLHPVGEGWLWMDNTRSTGFSFVCWQIPRVDPLKCLLQRPRWNRNYIFNIFRDFSYVQ